METVMGFSFGFSKIGYLIITFAWGLYAISPLRTYLFYTIGLFCSGSGLIGGLIIFDGKLIEFSTFSISLKGTLMLTGLKFLKLGALITVFFPSCPGSFIF